jgi:hypothetical protein
MSKLQLRINDLLLHEQDPIVRAELVAQQAAYFARIGMFSDAQAKIAEVRAVFGDGRSGRVTALIMLAEGLLLHYEKLGPGALDRVSRAQLLGSAMKDRGIVGLTSAWRAYLEFEASRYDSAVLSLRLAIESSSDREHGTRARCAIVLSIAFSLCGDRLERQRWFMKGRDHALHEGDQASIDALLHNRAAFGLAWHRAQRCRRELDQAEILTVRSEIASARNLQKLTHIGAHASYIDLCDARLQVLEGQYQSAMDLLERTRTLGPFPGGHFNQDLVALEIAFCQLKLRDIEGAVNTFATIQTTSFNSLDIDDQLVASWMLHQLAIADSRLGSLSEAERELQIISSEYDNYVSALRVKFSEFTEIQNLNNGA